jgi:hypothetical protein
VASEVNDGWEDFEGRQCILVLDDKHPTHQFRVGAVSPILQPPTAIGDIGKEIFEGQDLATEIVT